MTQLLQQKLAKHDTICLKHFYRRRALRILPVYFFKLLALGVLTRYSQSPADWLAYLLWPGLLALILHRQKGGAGLLKFLLPPLLGLRAKFREDSFPLFLILEFYTSFHQPWHKHQTGRADLPVSQPSGGAAPPLDAPMSL